MTAGEYCRAIEAYLCRENGGHLVRIVGPAFQVVAGWHAAGHPVRGREAGHRSGAGARSGQGDRAGARRPLRVEFCEADVQDAFAAWRRAVGVGMAGARDDADARVGARAADAGHRPTPPAPRPGRGPSLAAHVDRAMQRLTQALLDLGRFAPDEASAARAAMEAALATLDRLQAEARGARGEARAALLAAARRSGRGAGRGAGRRAAARRPPPS